MDDAVRAALVRLCGEHGTGLLDDPAKLEAYLRDTCPGRSRETYCLLNAVQTGALLDLRQAVSQALPGDVGPQRAAARLHADLGFDPEAADWTAKSLWEALGGLLAPNAYATSQAGGPAVGGGAAGSPPGAGAPSRPGTAPAAPPAGPGRRRWMWLAVGIAVAVVAVAVVVVLRQTGGSSAAGKSRTVSVSPGGSLSLEDALAQVKDGGSVKLRAGAYQVPSLAISSSVKLVGEGAELTTVVLGSGDQPGVSISGSKNVAVNISGVTLRQSDSPGETAGDVVTIGGSARVVLRDCRLEGGGNGVGSYGSSTVVIQQCRIAGSYRSVVNAADRSRLSMVNSTVSDSLQGRGLCAKGSARVVVDGGRFTGNYGEGLIAQDSARVAVTGGVFSRNEHSGLRAQGEARLNATGVSASGNGLVAIGYSHSASGSVKGCDLSSGQAGRTPYPCVSVGDQADVDCTENECASTGGFGINYSGQSTGRVTGNDCSDCARGIGVEGGAQPSIGPNQAGVAYL